jgi:hypothetical protein
MMWTRTGDAYSSKGSDDISLVVSLLDHRWVVTVAIDGSIVHLSEHGGQDEAFDAALTAAQRARHLRRFMPNAPARSKPDAVPPVPGSTPYR